YRASWNKTCGRQKPGSPACQILEHRSVRQCREHQVSAQARSAEEPLQQCSKEQVWAAPLQKYFPEESCSRLCRKLQECFRQPEFPGVRRRRGVQWVRQQIRPGDYLQERSLGRWA